MKITEIEAPLFLPPPMTPRSEGVHLSSIIRCIATEQGILKPEWAEELSLVDAREIKDPVAILRINIGLAWEQHYIPNILGPAMGVVDHPGERQVDGIYMTPDGESVSVITHEYNVARHSLIVHEAKATYKGTKKVVDDLNSQWMWLAQMKGYCKALKTRWAMLHVLFLCGDYKFPITPILWCRLIEFTQEEIDSNWDLLRDYRDFRMNNPQLSLD